MSEAREQGGHDAAPAALLGQGLARLGLEAAPVERLLAFVALLQKWNRRYNLTAVRDPRRMVIQHLLDSLAVLPYVTGPRVADVGTGAGLPGIPLALLLSEYAFVLLDSNGKKTRFVAQAVAELGIDNVEVRHARVEAYRPARPFDTVICRAYATMGDIIASAGHLCRPGGQLLAMKGRYPAQELRQVAAPFFVIDVVALDVPFLDAARHLVRIGHGGGN